MQLTGFGALAAEMIQHGYRVVYLVELECHQHGAFRGAIAGTDDILLCPKCGQASESAILGRGLTRTPEIPWLCVSPAAPASARKAAESYEGTSGSVKVIDRQRRPEFWARARRELDGIKA
jgi:hypothetical protein